MASLPFHKSIHNYKTDCRKVQGLSCRREREKHTKNRGKSCAIQAKLREKTPSQTLYIGGAAW
jgi:hypothetical protein